MHAILVALPYNKKLVIHKRKLRAYGEFLYRRKDFCYSSLYLCVNQMLHDPSRDTIHGPIGLCGSHTVP